MKMYPLKFQPVYKQRIWGGQKLREFFGKDIPPLEKIGESWELTDLPNDKSVITNGELAGKTLEAVIKKYPKEVTGDKNFAGPFPLLIKFLDAEDILSVQVHPDEETCRKTGKGEPKTECWYIVAAQAGAVIYKGLKKGVTKEQFAQAIEKGTVDKLLVKIPVQKGQCHFLPAGTAHAIGAGLLIAEIQMPSDTTYRISDWGRLDQSGKPRQLHIKEALESIHFDSSNDNLSVTTVGRLVDCKYFKVDKGHQAKGCETLLSPGIVKVLIILQGSGIIIGKNSDSVDFKAGETIVIPAVYEGAMQFLEETQYLTVIIPAILPINS